ncbi:hypothetical protein QE152_g9757 [Popillia japonica]|uniref:Uncharacterized protein n=1 Tax=Popillia japonica TaxID=7064 RepID=A0AAW1LTL5_POPJA
MKEHLSSRSNLKHLPADIAAFLKKNYGHPIEQVVEVQPPSKRGLPLLIFPLALESPYLDPDKVAKLTKKCAQSLQSTSTSNCLAHLVEVIC